ncbi:MAG: acyl carrier protein [Alphaproteobacteria bacterium]|nr:acyl carrier protein [Alphaproteobacteria bacterium]MBF0392152.1 acyl carrier protein [Alphaproteobacteria bacterium]
MDLAKVQELVFEVVAGLVADWDLDAEIGATTRLVANLEFESIDIIQMVVAFEERLQRRNLGFEKLLMVDGRYVDDLSLGQIAAFLHQRLAVAA